MLLVDYELSDLSGDRVDDYAAHMAAGSIAATGVGPHPERHLPRHSNPPCPLDLNKPSPQHRRQNRRHREQAKRMASLKWHDNNLVFPEPLVLAARLHQSRDRLARNVGNS
jgi:hypothetical protein